MRARHQDGRPVLPRLSIILIATLLTAPPSVGAEAPARRPGGTEMSRHDPEMTEAVIAARAYRFDAETVSPDDALRVAGYFLESHGGEGFPFIYGIPGRDRLFLVSAGEDRSARDFGRRFFLLDGAGGDLRPTFAGRGANDSYILDPTIFSTGGKRLILAETGTEYSWGLWAFDLRGSTLVDMGSIPVAYWDGESLVNPLGRARVIAGRGGYRVEFRADLEMNPGGVHPWRLVRRGEAIVFEQRGDRFVLREDAIGGQACFFHLEERREDGERGRSAAAALDDLRHHYERVVPWLEKNAISHSFQEAAPVRMVPLDGRAMVLDGESLGTSLGVVLRTRDGHTKILPGVITDADLIPEMRPFFGIAD